MPVLGEVALEVGEIALQQKRDPAGIVGYRVSGRFEQLGHDLGIGFSVEADAGGGGQVHSVVSHRGVNRAAAGAVAQEESPVDVEEDELALHAGVGPVLLSAAHCRQSVTPRRLQMRQMKVPQRVQGYPSDARSSRPQARHTIASVAGGRGF
jgi:hypothetical protein